MKQRSVVWVLVLSFFTLGIYAIIWTVKTKNEMNSAGADIPSAWWMLTFIFFFPALWWYWRYSVGVEHVTRGKMGTVIAYILLLLLQPITQGILQSEFNRVAASGSIPTARALG